MLLELWIGSKESEKMNRSGKKIMMIIACFAVALIGLYMQFFHEDKPTQKKDSNENLQMEQETEKNETETFEYDYSDKELPDEENESEAELYTETNEEPTKVYFTNTDLIDKSSMPIEVHSEIARDTQRYLYINGYTDVTELIVNDDEFLDYDDRVSFNCDIPGRKEKLQITYNKMNRQLMFAIVYLDEDETE